MKIENLRTEQKDSKIRAVATLVWENRRRPPQDIYLETTEEFAGDVSCNPHAFLIAGIIPAMHYGESRIAIDAEICPQLKEGLITNMNWLSHWHGGDRKPIPIEAKTLSNPPEKSSKRRAACFFSGGVDALATLIANRINFPLEHPSSIKDGIIIYGLLAHEENEPDPAFNYVLDSLLKMTHEAGLTLIPIYTNVYSHLLDLDRDYLFWGNKFEAAALSAVAHFLSLRLTEVNIASTFDISDMHPIGSHPVLDHNYSSSDLQIKHDGITRSRLARTELITKWDTALDNLRVCNRPRTDRADILNCSKCEKCVRTMLAFVALGAEKECGAFNFDNLNEKSVSKVRIRRSSLEIYKELITPLKQQGRHDLVRGVERVIRRCQEKDFKGVVKRIDRNVFRGSIANLAKKSS